jgi:hypothetical protein
MAIRTTMRTIQSQVGTVILSLEAGRLYAEWMAGGGVETLERFPRWESQWLGA